MQGLTLPLTATLLCASAWAVREDLLAHRIPNRLTGSLLCLGFLLQLAFGGWSGLGQAALGTLVGFAVLFPLYLLRAMGAGDVKLLAAMGALLGPYWALVAGVGALLAGGALGVAYLIVGAVRAALAAAGGSWSERLHEARVRMHQLRRERFPYALAIAIGALTAVAQRGDLQAVYQFLSEARP